MNKIKESKNIFPCTVVMENQDYDEVYYYLDTPEYGLSWRYFDDVEQEDIENYKYIIKNTADLRKAIDDLEEDFIHGYGNSYFKLSENYMEDLLNRGKTLVRVFNVKKEHKERVYIIRVKPAQNVELATVIKESTEDNTETGVVVTDLSDGSYDSYDRKIKIADGVTTIKDEAFFGYDNLESIVLPSSVTSIGALAFYDCYSLKSIVLPNSITKIDTEAFRGCYNLKSIALPNSITEIENAAFSNCSSLKSIVLPNSITKIKGGTFAHCSNLASITIPKSVTSIWEFAFWNCRSLTTINYTGTRDQWNAIRKEPNWRKGCKRNIVINYNYQESSTFDGGSVELALAESFEKTIRNLQKEGLFENIKSFDLDFTGKGINIKLNESRPENRNVSFKKRSNLKENESDKVTYMQDFSIEDYYFDISDVEDAAADEGININFDDDEIYATASSEEALKEFLYDWGLIENDADFEAGLLN